ncbi:4Fe-4S dicluster-binding protein [Kyrpidia spormannii]|uniref:4Fe-4S dicluster-binding protein n=1 Tax=Kyrpidia spormannii TaxID=2055160 RepID=UPI002F25EF56
MHRYVDWSDLNLEYKIVARIDQQRRIQCNKCYISCEDAAHQCIDRVQTASGNMMLVVDESECVGCNLFFAVQQIRGIADLQNVHPSYRAPYAASPRLPLWPLEKSDDEARLWCERALRRSWALPLL